MGSSYSHPPTSAPRNHANVSRSASWGVWSSSAFTRTPRACTLVATSPDTWDLAEGEFVPWVPLAWQMTVAHDKRLDSTIIAEFGSGKTVGIGAVFTYWCCMIPNFKAMDAAPVGWQAKQMYDAIRQELAGYDNRHERPTRLSRLITRVVEKPYPKITFHNGSTIEFMSADNPYLTADQLGAIERRIKDPEKRKQLTKSERPLPRGNECTPELLEPCQSREMDDVMRHARENNLHGYYVEEAQRAGTVLWVTPPNEFDRYVLIGDPGQNTPDRNSGVVVALKVTGLPRVPAEVAAFHWVDGQGSYWPFINQMEEWYRAHTQADPYRLRRLRHAEGLRRTGVRPEGDAGRGRAGEHQQDAHGGGPETDPGQAETAHAEGDSGHLDAVGGVEIPDTKLRQDIASCLFIAADVLNRLFIIDEEQEAEEDDSEYEDVAHMRRRPHRRKTTRHQRTAGRVQR